MQVLPSRPWAFAGLGLRVARVFPKRSHPQAAAKPTHCHTYATSGPRRVDVVLTFGICASCFHRPLPRMRKDDEAPATSLEFSEFIERCFMLTKQYAKVFSRVVAHDLLRCALEWLNAVVEISRGTPQWDAVGHLSMLAELTPAKGKRVPLALKRSLSIELHNRKGRGLRNMSNLTMSMSVGRKTTPSKRRRWKPGGSATGQSEKPMVSSRTGRRINAFQLWNKYTESRSPGASKHNLFVLFLVFHVRVGRGGWMAAGRCKHHLS